VRAPRTSGWREGELTIVNVEYEGTKIWLPSTIVAHKGDRVR
jgi:hypothetical protein